MTAQFPWNGGRFYSAEDPHFQAFPPPGRHSLVLLYCRLQRRKRARSNNIKLNAGIAVEQTFSSRTEKCGYSALGVRAGRRNHISQRADGSERYSN